MSLFPAVLLRFSIVYDLFFGLKYTLFFIALEPFLRWWKTLTTWRKIRSGQSETSF
jgi:hypothetical protein